MKKYVNGQYIEMTDEEVERMQEEAIEAEYQEHIHPRTEQEGIAALCKSLIKDAVAGKDKTLGIACMAFFPVYVQNKQHDSGEVATHPETGYPYECMTAYDGTVQQDWTIDNRALWKPWHSRSAEYALPWEAPTGAHDMYKAGEYMIWTDKHVYECLTDTDWGPDVLPGNWRLVE